MNRSTSRDTDAFRPDDWLRIEVARDALEHNLRLFRDLVPQSTRLMAVVKADGYGHGLVPAAHAFLAGGADVLGVHYLDEVRRLRAAGIDTDILVLGPLRTDAAAEALRLGAEVTVASREAVSAVVEAARRCGRARVHLKVETGVCRQGIALDEVAPVLNELTTAPEVELVGLSSHFADIEDTTDHSFAEKQQARFEQFRQALAEGGFPELCLHMSCSAATILWSGAHRDLARVGIAAYGFWPSRETLVSARAHGQNQLTLRPAVTWKTRVAQIKPWPEGQTVGYGRTWKAKFDSRIAVLPLGYADGYPRLLSNRAEVLIGGKRAPIRGRICMNLCMADVTHIETARVGDEVVLLGRQGEDEIRAEQLAEWAGTIPYEVLTWPGATWRRVTI
ncbi:MAG: alanine racemase [bacterium]